MIGNSKHLFKCDKLENAMTESELESFWKNMEGRKKKSNFIHLDQLHLYK